MNAVIFLISHDFISKIPEKFINPDINTLLMWVVNVARARHLQARKQGRLAGEDSSRARIVNTIDTQISGTANFFF